MKIKGKGFSLTLPNIGQLKVEKLPIDSKGIWKETYLVTGKVDGAYKASPIIVVDGEFEPIQTKSELDSFNLIWLSASEFVFKTPEKVRVNLPPEALNWNRVLELFSHVYRADTLIHEFLHLWLNFESDIIDDMLGAYSEDVYNAVEDFIIYCLTLKMAKKGVAIKPSWVSEQQLISIHSPALLAKMPFIKVLQTAGCFLEGIDVHSSDGGNKMDVVFHFSGPKIEQTEPKTFKHMINELLLVQLAAYEDIIQSTPLKDVGFVRFTIDVPKPYLPDKLAGSPLRESYVKMGKCVVSNFKRKPFFELHRALTNYIASCLNSYIEYTRVEKNL